MNRMFWNKKAHPPSFIANYQGLSDFCGGSFHSANGVGKSHPGFPIENYPPNQDCVWKLTGPENTQMNLKFTEFMLEFCEDCSCDYVQVSE